MNNIHTEYINLQNLINISRGDNRKALKYLKQFQELIPERIGNLKEHLQTENRKMIRQTLHQMSPQLQFFGVPDITNPIKRLEQEYQTIPTDELNKMVENILLTLENACLEVNKIINENF